MSSVVPQTPFNEYTGDGVATVYPYEFQLLSADDLIVTIDGVVVPSSDFVLTGLGVQAGGDITFDTAPLSGTTVLLSREIALQRGADYQYNGALREATVDEDFNRLWQALQGQNQKTDGAIRLPYPEQSPELPAPADRLNTVLGFDQGGATTVVDMASVPERLLQREQQTVAAGQTLITFASIVYTRGISSLIVSARGGELVNGVDYTETSNTSITLTTAPTRPIQMSFVAGSPTNGTVEDDAALVSYTPAGTGSVATNVQAKLRESISLLDKGADSTGASDSAADITNLIADTLGEQSIPAGTYRIDSVLTPAGRDIALDIDPAAEFTGAGRLRFDDFVLYQHSNTWLQRFARKTFGAAYDAFWDAFLVASIAIATSTARVVALYGRGNASANGARAWGANVVGCADADGGIAIGLEVDAQIIGAGNTSAQAYGVVIASSGDLPCENAIQIQGSNAASAFVDGIVFDWDAASNGVTGSLITASGAVGAAVESFVSITGVSATSAEIDLPSFVVQATQPNTVNRIGIRGAATGSAPRIEPATGSDTNIHVDIRGRGTSGVNIQSGDATNKIRVNNTGVGFYGTAPVAKPTITGSRGGNAALASLLTALAAQGLVTDSTTA